jgi:hypothetical protein
MKDTSDKWAAAFKRWEAASSELRQAVLNYYDSQRYKGLSRRKYYDACADDLDAAMAKAEIDLSPSPLLGAAEEYDETIEAIEYLERL